MRQKTFPFWVAATTAVLVLAGCSSNDEAAPAVEPTQRVAAGADCRGESRVFGTQLLNIDQVSMTLTSQECVAMLSAGELDGESGSLIPSVPDQVADLSVPVSDDGQRSGEFISAGLIDVPSDIGAWLDGPRP